MLRTRAVRTGRLLVLAVPVLLGSACLGYPAEGAVATPVAPGQGAASRLPQLLQQLQGSGAGANLELFDQPSSQVLGAQDAQGKDTSSTPAATASATAPATAQPTSINLVNPTNTPTPRTTPTRTPTAAPTPQPTATASPSATATATTTATASATATATPTPTATSTPTPTPTRAAPPTEGRPPTER